MQISAENDLKILWRVSSHPSIKILSTIHKSGQIHLDRKSVTHIYYYTLLEYT